MERQEMTPEQQLAFDGFIDVIQLKKRVENRGEEI